MALNEIPTSSAEASLTTSDEMAVKASKSQLDPPASEDATVTEEGETESQTMSGEEECDEDEEEEYCTSEEEEEEDEFVIKSRTLKRLQAQAHNAALLEKSLDINSSNESSSPSSSDSDKDDQPASFYTKPKLKATGHGSLLQTGADPSTQQTKGTSKPIYATRQLKATGFGDKLKTGSDVPREYVAHDPNSTLGQVYQSASGKFKATGFGDKLKQGQDVPREYVAEDPNAKLGDVYKSVSFKQTGFGDKLKQGQDVPREYMAKDPNQHLGKVYASVPLKKSGIDPEQLEKSKKKSVPSTTLPQVQLQKTQLPTQKPGSKTTFELPEEFSIAKQNLKRRTERPWYSSGLPKAQAPKQKWFFQRGEWMPKRARSGDDSTNDSSNQGSSWFDFGRRSKEINTTATTTTTYYRGSNTTLHHPPKKTQQSNHEFLLRTTNNNNASTKTKKQLKPGSKQYYQEIQRRRGLTTPKDTTNKKRLFWKILLLWLPLLSCHYVIMVSLYPEWSVSVPPSLQPKVDAVRTTIQPHWNAVMDKIQPHWKTLRSNIQPHAQRALLTAHEHLHPRAVTLVNHVCSRVEAYELPNTQYQLWVEPIHLHVKSACQASRTRLGMMAQNGDKDVQEEPSEDPSLDIFENDGNNKEECHCRKNNPQDKKKFLYKLKEALSKLFPKRNRNNSKPIEDIPRCDCSVSEEL